MSGNHGEDDGAKPKNQAEAHQEQIHDLEQESLQRVEGDEPGFSLDDENNERSNPQTHDLQHLGENGHGPLVQTWLNRYWLYWGGIGCAELHCFDHAFARATTTRTKVNPKSPELRLVLQQLPRNHQPLDFACALADGAQLHVTIKFFRRIVFDKTVPAMDLHAFVGASDGHFAGVELGHGRFQRGLHAV